VCPDCLCTDECLASGCCTGEVACSAPCCAK
jgi:hypothetical protein